MYIDHLPSVQFLVTTMDYFPEVVNKYSDSETPTPTVVVKMPIVVGENMRRVKHYANKVGGHTYRPRKLEPFDLATALRRNRQWILKMKRQGREFIDIGPDFARREAGANPSLFYNTERRQLDGYEKYSKVFIRLGKSNGGVYGIDCW